jgi:hypothetical protein
MRQLRLAILVSCFFLSPWQSAFAQQEDDEKILSTADEVASDLATIPCSHNERRGAVEALFKKMASDASVVVQTVAGAENVVVTRPGSSSEKIVVGAHYDFVDLGCGAVDNWSGIVVLAHIYRTVLRFPTNKTLVFVGFGNEEKGLLGSKGMASAIGESELPQYCAMINLDSFGLGLPTALTNLSSGSLGALAKEMAGGLKMPFEMTSVPGANSDSTSFLDRSIPAITLSGITPDWMSILHTIRDQGPAVKPASVYLGYRLGLSMLVQIDESPCTTYRGSNPVK